MNEPYTPYMFSPVTEFMIYFWFMGLVHAAVLVAGLILALPFLFRGARRYLTFARGYAVFNLILVLVCAVLNLLWSYTIWGHVYFSTDYVTDFSPFWPITQSYIEAPFGDMVGRVLPGFTIWHVRGIWFAFAFSAWVTAIFLYSRARRLWTRKKTDIEPDECTVPLEAARCASPSVR